MLIFLNDGQLDNLQEATLNILENTGIKFPTEKALVIFTENGAEVDHVLHGSFSRRIE